MKTDQTVSEMVAEILSRQARKRADRAGVSFGEALAAVTATEAGAQLRGLGEGRHRHEEARAWQASLALERARRRADDLGWRWPPEGSGPPPSGPVPLRWSSPEPDSVTAGPA
jgi:hypothetical protein